MGLPLPQWDALGMALWTVTDLEIKSAFKKLSLLTHPDKNRNNLEAARDAFEKVKAAHEVISDEMLRDDYIKKYIDENKTVEASNWVPPKDGAELEKELEVEMKKQEDKATLMKKHYASFQDKIKEKMEQRLKRKKEERERQQQKKQESSDSEDDLPAYKKKKGPQKKRARRGVF